MKNIKKIVSLCLCLAMSLCVMSCGGNTSDSASNSASESASVSVPDASVSSEKPEGSNSDVTSTEDSSVEDSSLDSSVEDSSSDSSVEDEVTYTITYDVSGGSLSSMTQTVVFGKAFTLEVPTKTGYLFQGWYLDGALFEDGIWNIEDDVVLVASWTEDPASNGAYTDRF